MIPASILLVAKAPVAGWAKTRLARSVGSTAAAHLAAAALLDTLDVCERAFPPGHRVLALDGRLSAAARGEEIAARCRRWTVIPQRGQGLAARLAAAHGDAATVTGTPMLQIGMDTPQLTVGRLRSLAALLSGPACCHGTATGRAAGSLSAEARCDAVVAPAQDGGWWALALRHPEHASALTDVAMSTSRTGFDTASALEASGATVRVGERLLDVDDAADAEAACREAPASRFARAWCDVNGSGRRP